MNRPRALRLDDEKLALALDLYQITIMAGYFAKSPDKKAVFELFTRRLPPHRQTLIACGLEQVLHYLSSLYFSAKTIDYLRSLPVFAGVKGDFWDYLASFRFDLDVHALAEGTPFFAGEPILRVTGNILAAQIVETHLLSLINAQTIVASKAARIVEACRGASVFEFGMRRAHGPEAATYAARAAYIGGFAGTSNVLAAKELGMPVVGTMAHSWVMSHGSEERAFNDFQELFPEACLLIDTYDLEAAAHMVASLPAKPKAVRIDSGNLLEESFQVRKILDQKGLRQTQIQVSGDLNEVQIAELTAAGAPIDVYAVGTELVLSTDAPSLNVVYKLVACTDEGGKWQPVAKRSSGKKTLAGAKQIWRQKDGNGRYTGDILALDEETDLPGEKLLVKVMEAGSICYDLPDIEDIRAYSQGLRQALGHEFFDPLLASESHALYPVALSGKLAFLQEVAVH